MTVIFLSAEVLLANLLRYFPVGRGVPTIEVVRFCENIKKQIIGLGKGYCVAVENDSRSLHSAVMDYPSRYEIFRDEYRLKRRIDGEMVNTGIPKEVQEILEKTAKQLAEDLSF